MSFYFTNIPLATCFAFSWKKFHENPKISFKKSSYLSNENLSNFQGEWKCSVGTCKREL